MVFIISDETVLLARRLNTWFGENEFAPPGGNIDENETAIMAAIREVHEEVNLEVKPEDLTLFHREMSEANAKTFDNYYYCVSNYTGVLNNNEPTRHSGLDWYPINDLPSNTMPLVVDLMSKL